MLNRMVRAALTSIPIQFLAIPQSVGIIGDITVEKFQHVEHQLVDEGGDAEPLNIFALARTSSYSPVTLST